MKKICKILLLSLGLLVLTACSVKKTEEERLRDVEFTVLDHDEIPEEFLAEIEASKEEPMMLTYGDKGYLYAARGYGVQDTTGYSVKVEQCYETKNGIRVVTSLLGPEKEEKILKKKTCPYVVIKMEYTDKEVEFR